MTQLLNPVAPRKQMKSGPRESKETRSDSGTPAASAPARAGNKPLRANSPVVPASSKPVTPAKPAAPIAATVPPRLREGALTSYSDADLVKETIKGNTEAYGELVCRYQYAIRTLARSMVRDFQASEDLSQDAFIKAFNSIADLKEPEKFGAWVSTILRHSVLDHLRSVKKSLSLEDLQEEGFEIPQAEEPDMGPAAIEAHEDERRTYDALANLRQDYREIIILKHVEKMSYKEIATRLNMSVSAVGEKLSRVRTLLKRRLEKQQVKVEKQD